MKSRVFIGSSTESLEIAYAIQENLERDAEVTVWTQGIFEISRFSLDSLLEALDDFDFGIFVLAPDDVAIIRDQQRQVARDNVVFELGLFIGRLGKERNFIIVPREFQDLHLPTDLLGMTPATFEPHRQDNNLTAALGPACHRIQKAIVAFGRTKNPCGDSTSSSISSLCFDEGDKKAVLSSWFGSRSIADNTKVIIFADVDHALGLEPETTKLYIKEIAAKYNLVVEHEGGSTILFKRMPSPLSAQRGSR